MRFLPHVPDLSPSKTRPRGGGPVYAPRSWSAPDIVDAAVALDPWVPTPPMSSASFLEHLSAWRPLEAPLRAWFQRSRESSANALQIRLSQLADCLWSCRSLARHRGHPMYRPFAAAFESVLEARRQLEIRGRRGLARARPVLDDVESTLSDVLIELPGNMVPLTLDGRVFSGGGTATGEGLRFISQAGAQARWRSLGGGRWVDLGCGDGTSVSALAQSRPETSFVGMDIGARSKSWPSNVRYEALDDGDAASLHRAALACVEDVDVVSLLFPIHVEQQGALAVVHQVRTALALLKGGGQAVVVSEDPIAVRAAVRALCEAPSCASIDVLDGIWSGAQLKALGIAPYRPTWSELTPSPAGVADEVAGELSWAMVVFFVRAP